MLGLINDLRDHRVTFPAAALSRARALRFVYLFPPIRLYKHQIRLDIVIPLVERLIERD
jgi:hypothetical protein